MSLVRLPMEIVSLITELLDVQDIFNLGSSCRPLSYLIRSDATCRLVLQRWKLTPIAQKKAKFSAEATEAEASRAYAKGLRRIAKRRNAVCQGEPFSVIIVAIAEHFVYSNGTLCYTVGKNQLRVLNVHCSATYELVIQTPMLLKRAFPEFNPERPYSFRPLHCSHEILSCLYSYKGLQGCTINQLVVLSLKSDKIITTKTLASSKLFIRNDENHLVCGTNLATGLDGFQRWTLQSLNLKTQRWAEAETVLWNFAGHDINVDVCFEIFDGYLYCLSNKTRFHPEHGKWNSFYTVICFPLSEITRGASLSPPMQNLWRRHAEEGPVDDRWNSLHLTRDESSGKLFIVESRRECLVDNAQSQRTCYKKELSFDRSHHDDSEQTQPPSAARDALLNDESYSDDDEGEVNGHPGAWDSETHRETRLSENIHVGDSGTVYSIYECFIWSYNPSCDTFVDLINHHGNVRVRVRPKHTEKNVIREAQLPLSHRKPEASYVRHAAKLWPPEPVLPSLDVTLAPQKPFQDVEWFMDERSLVYAPSLTARGRCRPLVLMSFDPAIHLPGYPRKTVSSKSAPGISRMISPDGCHPKGGCQDNPLGNQFPDSVSSPRNLMEHDSVTENEASSTLRLIPGDGLVQHQQALYIMLPKTEESPCGFEFSLPSSQ